MESSYSSSSTRQPMFSNTMITGGTFLQQIGDQIHDNRRISVHGAKGAIRILSLISLREKMNTIETGGFEYLKDAVSPAAFHNSGERFDPPKCHMNTRVAVIEEVMGWILGCDPATRHALIMWLSGAAGAGKSAIAQSIAELCYAQGRILASFFFGRSDPTRNHAKSLFATLAYQLALVLPQTRDKIVDAVEYDPLIFTRSLSTQFASLIVEPLHDLIESGFWDNPSSPRLIIMDGLDECLDSLVQCTILDVIIAGSQAHRLPLIFLVASRPEHDLSMKFNSSEINNILSRLVLDHSYRPDKDIEQFFRDSFHEIKKNHTFTGFSHGTLSPEWPRDELIQTLVKKSSGQFIYASTVIKYVKSTRHNPANRLEIVLNLRPPSRDLPFAELDALYTQVFSSVENLEPVLDIIALKIIHPMAFLGFISDMMKLDMEEIEPLFCDLGSLISFTSSFMRHASLSDFLVDKNRSKELYIDIPLKRNQLIHKCFQVFRPGSKHKESAIAAASFFDSACRNLAATFEFRDDIIDFSIEQVHKEIMEAGLSSFSGPRWAFVERFAPFLITFIQFVQNAEFPDAPHLYNHHFRCSNQLLMKLFDFYYSDASLTVIVALFVFSFTHKDLRPAMFNFDFLFYLPSDIRDVDSKHLCLLWVGEHHAPHSQLLEDFLRNRLHSGKYSLDRERCATTVLYCMAYLCDHSAKPQKMPRTKSNRRDNKLRMNAPWRWRQRVGQHGTLSQARRKWRRTRDFFTDHGFILRARLANSFGCNMSIPRVADRIWTRKFYLGLGYLLYFLPRSGRSQELIDCCRQRSFAQRSQEFPNRSRRSRRAIADYLERMDAEEAD